MACFGEKGARGVLFLPRISYALAAASSIRQGCMHVGRDAHGHDPTAGRDGCISYTVCRRNSEIVIAFFTLALDTELILALPC